MLDRIRATWRFFADPYASWSIKLLFLFAVVYVVSPVDVVPDVLPIVGWLDDLGVFGIASAFVLSSIQPYRKGGEKDPKRVRANQANASHPQQSAAASVPTQAATGSAERPIVTEVWSSSNRQTFNKGWQNSRAQRVFVETKSGE